MSNDSACLRGVLGTLAAALLLPCFGQTQPMPQAPAPAASQATQEKSSPSSGQEKKATGSTQTAPALRATTRLIQVSVVAQDKHGQPVTDLKRDEFRVFDKGAEQKVEFFAMETQRLLPAEAAPLPRDTWTNRMTQREGVPASVTLILLDGLNTKVADQRYAEDQVVKFLSQIHPEDHIALYTLGSDLRVLHDFTRDSTSLLRALSKYKGYNGPKLPEEGGDEGNTGLDALDQFIQNANAAITENMYIQRAYRTVAALEAIAQHVAPIPGRKSLIWVSGGFPITIAYDGLPVLNPAPGTDDRNFLALVERAARALNDANLAVYPVDAGGLVTPVSSVGRNPYAGVAVNRRMTPTGAPAPQMGSPQQRLWDTMEAMASRTGGRAFYNTNDLSAAIRRSMDDGRLVYTLAYTPAHDDWNGKFREIKVECRRPGVKLRYRAGYFALPDQPLDADGRREMLAEAERSPLVATEIGLTARISPGMLDGREAKVVTVIVDGKDVHFEEKDGRHTTDMLLVVAQRAGDGQIVHSQAHDLALKLKEETYQTVKQNGLKVTVTTVLEPGVRQFRLVLLDAATGKLGSLDIPLAAAPAAGGTGENGASERP